MISRMSHASIYVLDVDAARTFYTEKLGFEIRTDVKMDGFTWLTVGPKGQPDLEIALMEVGPPQFDADGVEQMRALIAKGALGAGVFETDDVAATYRELSGKGVEFIQEPQQRPYGTEALFRDNSGNWFSLCQR